MSNYPRNLRYSLRRLSGYSTNIFKLQTQNATNAANGQIITVNLPTNSVLNMRSLAMHFNAAITNSSGAVFAGFPANMASVIDRIEILVGGVQVAQGHLSYGTAATIKKRLFNKRNKQETDDKVLQGSYPVDITAADQPPGNFIIDEWQGFLNELEPQFLDSGIIPSVQLRIYLAGTNILRLSAAKAGGQTLGFDLTNIYFTIETASISDGLYDISIQEQQSAAGFIEVAYKNYYSFTNGFSSAATGISSSSRFSVASQCVDAMYTIMRNTTGTESYQTGDQDQVAMTGAIGPNVVSKFFNMTSAGIGDWRYTVNNVQIPQYSATPLDALHLVGVAKDECHANDRGTLVTTDRQWLQNYWVACIRLCHAGDLEDIRVLSGLDTRGTNSINTFNTRASGAGGINGTVEMYTLVETTSTMRIGLGRSIEIIN
jgi:hypothetical protein